MRLRPASGLAVGGCADAAKFPCMNFTVLCNRIALTAIKDHKSPVAMVREGIGMAIVW